MYVIAVGCRPNPWLWEWTHWLNPTSLHLPHLCSHDDWFGGGVSSTGESITTVPSFDHRHHLEDMQTHYLSQFSHCQSQSFFVKDETHILCTCPFWSRGCEAETLVGKARYGRKGMKYVLIISFFDLDETASDVRKISGYFLYKWIHSVFKEHKLHLVFCLLPTQTGKSEMGCSICEACSRRNWHLSPVLGGGTVGTESGREGLRTCARAGEGTVARQEAVLPWGKTDWRSAEFFLLFYKGTDSKYF